MPRRKWNLNTVYISERLQECLRPISGCALTTVVAPMGYGKTTAVNWFLSRRAEAEHALILRVSVYSDNLAIFWKSVQDAFTHAGLDFLQDYTCPSDAASASLLMDDLCHSLSNRGPCYLFLDDFHLLTDGRAAAFLCALARRLPDTVHLIVASRDRFLSGETLVQLGSRVYQIGTEQLRLNHTELSIYARRCGTDLSDQQISSLLYSSEGWFSAIYLNLRTLFERGALPDRGSDIYRIFSAAMIDPLPSQQQEFLAVMGLADEFTVEMAEFVTGSSQAGTLLTALTEQNAFVKRLPDTVVFRFHHMMKECAERAFSLLPTEKQRVYRNRYGAWYETRRQYLHALSAYRAAGNDDGVLRVVQEDAGVLLSSLGPEQVLTYLAQCPSAVLKAHPPAILVLMRSMFNWHLIPNMLELRDLLTASIAEHPEIPEEEKGNLLGEQDLIMSFLMYNDISAMSRLHRAASAQMSRPAISIQSSGGWTFGSPSVLMMFHRTPGALDRELAEMNECMPHYYKITNGHGQGAEKIMEAEAAFYQGRFADAQIALEDAYARIAGNGQENMALCCDFLAWRLSLCGEYTPRLSFRQQLPLLLEKHNAAWINIFHATCAYTYALRGETAQIPEVFREHQLASIHFLAPGKPMMDLIENQVYLSQGAWAKVIGRSGGLLDVCGALHYQLVALHIRLQTAAAYEALGKRTEAQALLDRALQDALPDQLVMPFVENYRYLQALLAAVPLGPSADFLHRIQTLGDAWEARRSVPEPAAPPAALAVLTGREMEITRLIAAHMSNREIAERLVLTPGSVKQYINQIYSKLLLDGDARSKRKRLIAMISPNP